MSQPFFHYFGRPIYDPHEAARLMAEQAAKSPHLLMPHCFGPTHIVPEHQTCRYCRTTQKPDERCTNCGAHP